MRQSAEETEVYYRRRITRDQQWAKEMLLRGFTKKPNPNRAVKLAEKFFRDKGERFDIRGRCLLVAMENCGLIRRSRGDIPHSEADYVITGQGLKLIRRGRSSTNHKPRKQGEKP